MNFITPSYFQGGQYILELVDHYGGTFMRLFAAIVEAIGVFWIYGKLPINQQQPNHGQ